ncbi:metal-dependent hydrolase [Halohasta salina]|uniref:metal-dependent hydrolase n=1 Tax=Halohasta salina TaxID=2961621 RepID=UPI002AA2AF2F|nr:metal-dependent hydrolase [Halohasta salina]
MIAIGHVGITLVVCAPFVNLLVASGHRAEVPGWVGIALLVTLVPDVDLVVPWITHRGVTHSLLAAGCLGVVVAVVSTTRWGGTPITPDESLRRAIFGFVVGSGGVISHLLGDLITPMGIRPFFPFDSHYSLNLVYAKDLSANLTFIAVGIVTFWTVYLRSKDPLPTDGTTADELPAESEVHSVNP